MYVHVYLIPHTHSIIIILAITNILQDIFAHEEHALDIEVKGTVPISCGGIVCTTMMDIAVTK